MRKITVEISIKPHSFAPELQRPNHSPANTNDLVNMSDYYIHSIKLAYITLLVIIINKIFTLYIMYIIMIINLPRFT